MSTDSTVTLELTGEQRACVDGLRDVADFLEAHPEVPPVRAIAWISEYRDRDARDELTRLARALGARAVETQTDATVQISGAFGPVVLHADAKVHELASEEPKTPAYEPIIQRDGIPVTAAEDEAWSERI